MLGELLYEEKGKTIGMRVLASEGGDLKVEITLQTEGKILGQPEKSTWTYWSKSRADGTIYGEGGLHGHAGGDIVHVTGSGAAKSMG
jgi:hypothetical protein